MGRFSVGSSQPVPLKWKEELGTGAQSIPNSQGPVRLVLLALGGAAGEELLEGRYRIHEAGGRKVRLVGNDRLCRSDIARDWKDASDVAPAVNERPVGEWNVAEVICRGERAEFRFNGKTVNRLTRLSPARGRIQLQSEGCPVEFRRVEIRPLSATE